MTGEPDAARLAALADTFEQDLRGCDIEERIEDTRAYPLPWTSHYAAWSIAAGLPADLAQRVRAEVMRGRAAR